MELAAVSQEAKGWAGELPSAATNRVAAGLGKAGRTISRSVAARSQELRGWRWAWGSIELPSSRDETLSRLRPAARSGRVHAEVVGQTTPIGGLSSDRTGAPRREVRAIPPDPPVRARRQAFPAIGPKHAGRHARMGPERRAPARPPETLRTGVRLRRGRRRRGEEVEVSGRGFWHALRGASGRRPLSGGGAADDATSGPFLGSLRDRPSPCVSLSRAMNTGEGQYAGTRKGAAVRAATHNIGMHRLRTRRAAGPPSGPPQVRYFWTICWGRLWRSSRVRKSMVLNSRSMAGGPQMRAPMER